MVKLIDALCDSWMLQKSCGQLTKAVAQNYGCTKYKERNTEVQHEWTTQNDEIQAFYIDGTRELEERIQLALKNVV